MRLSQLALVVSFSVFAQATLAEQTPAPVITSVVNAEVRAMNAQLDQLEQRLAESERLRVSSAPNWKAVRPSRKMPS